jgi:hypothetical protein
MASTIKVDNIQNSTGQDLMVNGYPRQPGQIIEYLTSPCDGSSVTGLSGSYTWPNVTAAQTLSATSQVVTGSQISYTPPAGTSKVIYRFEYALNWVTEHAISHQRFFIDGVEVTSARMNRSGRYPEDKTSFEWPINIGGSATAATGRQASWTTPKTLSVQSRWYSASNNRNAHATTYWDGTSSVQFIMPVLTIIAIA